MLKLQFDRRINYAETAASLGQQITRTSVLRKPRHARVLVCRIIFRGYFVNRSLHLVNKLVPKSTQLRTIQDTNYNPQCRSDYDSSDDNMVANIARSTVQIETKNTFLLIKDLKVGLLNDSGSVCSILNEPLATEVINNSTLARWLTTAPAQDLKSFANEPIPVIGMMQAPVENNGWRIEDAEFVVFRVGLKPLIGRDLFEVLGISITQTLCSNESSFVNTVRSHCPFKTRIANQFPHIISRIGRSKFHIVKPKFHKSFQPKHQKVRKYSLIYNNELIVKLKNFLKKNT